MVVASKPNLLQKSRREHATNRGSMALLGTLGGGAARTVAVSLAGLGLFVVNQSGLSTIIVPIDRREHLGLRGGDLDPTRAVEENLSDDGEGESSATDDVDVPGCARDVFVTLHRKEGGGPACHGLLVRDDIVVTSAACSHLKHTFDFPGHGTVEATPHATLNERSARKAPGSRLGFLEAHPPFDHYHYRYAGERVRRTRVFLSMDANTDDGAETDVPVAMTCTDDDRPVAHNFPVNGEMIPLGQLADVVPQDVLWDDDIDTAPMLSYKTHRWYTRYVDLDDEQDKLDELMDRFEGPPGGVSLPDVEDNYDGRMSGLLEALDPRGHRHLDCFRNYFHRYRREHPFSGTHFFDWLDFGKGKFLLERNQKQKTFRRMKGDANCHKKEFNRFRIHYLTDEERAEREVYLTPSKDGKELIARYKHNDELVPQSGMEEPFTYMWDLEERMYVIDNTWDFEKYGEPKHSGLMAGKAALSAGEAYFGPHGKLWGFNFNSGHYQPEVPAISLLHRWMKDNGYNTTAVRWVGLSVGEDTWSIESCKEYDWGRVDVPGYRTAELKRLCKEVMESPTFMLERDIAEAEEDGHR